MYALNTIYVHITLVEISYRIPCRILLRLPYRIPYIHFAIDKDFRYGTSADAEDLRLSS